MVSFAADFWPLFWLVTGSAAAVTVVVAALVATVPSAWFRRHHRQQLGAAPVEWADRRPGQNCRAA